MSINKDEKKFKNTIKSTDFGKLQSKDEQFGFEESILSKNGKKKIKFFNLGKDNNWKKLLDSKIEKKITKSFKTEMKELSYIAK